MFEMPANIHVSRVVRVVTLAFAVAACGEVDERTVTDMLTTRTLGLAYLEENRLEEAEAEFFKLIELAPEEPLGYANLGLVYLRMGRYGDAEERINQALALEPGDPDDLLMLATVYNLTDRVSERRRALETALEFDPEHVRVLYNLAEVYAESDQPDSGIEEEYRRRLVDRASANVAARMQLVEVLLRRNQIDQALMHMEEIRRQIPDLPAEAIAPYDSALAAMRTSRGNDALGFARIVHNVLRVTQRYQAGFLDLVDPGGPLAGIPVLSFSQDITLRAQDAGAVLAALRFTDATAAAGLDVVPRPPDAAGSGEEPGVALALGDYDGDGDDDLYLAGWTSDRGEPIGFLFRNDFGHFVDVSGEAGVRAWGGETAALFADYDNDGHLDLYITRTGPNRLYRNTGDGRFRDVTAATGTGDAVRGHAGLLADFDHDGDLDIFLANTGVDRLFRNNLDGSFTEDAARAGVAGAAAPSRDAAFGDFDDDGDLDLFVVSDSGNVLYSNLRQGRFEDVTLASGLQSAGGSIAVAVGDYNNDGYLDLFVTGRGPESHLLYRNRGDGTFQQDTGSQEMIQSLRNLSGRDATFLDFDNDGFLDLLVAGVALERGGRSVLLFHNDGAGGYEDMSALLPADLESVARVAVADYNEDGDPDIFVAGLQGGVRLLRNDGGNANHYLNVQLVGLSTGSGKNNHFGIGAKLEVRAGDLYQMRVVTQPVTHLGLGQRVKADVVRIVWTNGVPHNLFYPGSDQDIIEQQTLKGSCAFLYTWDGQGYQFVTDVMWRSALGMPTGIMGGTQSYAPPHASQEYLKIPGELLQAEDGVYTLQITEELWEVAYFDQVRLLVIDHPDSVGIYVDERFVPPAPPSLRIYRVVDERVPVAASDERGNDLLAQIQAKDDVYVANLTPDRYQGVTTLHDLVLDLGDLAPADSVTLFLNGWVFPTDASINVALSQSGDLEVVFPYLQVMDASGRWRTAIENLSFPAGKNKTVIADLTGKFLTDDYRVRIRTNMEVYWDYIFFSVGAPRSSIRQTPLDLVAADLHYRGFSREYRKGGRYGPHWFDYSDVTTEPRWLQMEGYYTRYGDVLPLLEASDDRYVIMMAGDEVTVRFDASLAPELEPGWTRDFLIYTDGWIKDADLNTATGDAVLPLPFHGMTRYPYGPDETYPTDDAGRDFVSTYNTRWVTTPPKR
ncbi:MAG: VCBS repeat-containing protein [Gemmatimonadetes bacterium]|nr:VCBS repeat-containing protein [Gemmatimonadota bacterium]